MFHLLAALLSGIAVDVLATLVFHYTNKNRAVAAASVNALLTGLVLFVFVDVSKDYTLAIPYLIGIWIGGLIGIALKKRLECDMTENKVYIVFDETPNNSDPILGTFSTLEKAIAYVALSDSPFAPSVRIYAEFIDDMYTELDYYNYKDGVWRLVSKSAIKKVS